MIKVIVLSYYSDFEGVLPLSLLLQLWDVKTSSLSFGRWKAGRLQEGQHQPYQ